MSGRSARARRFTSVAAIVAGASVGTFAVTSNVIGATTPPTTTVAPTSAPTTAAPPTTTAAATTTAPPTTFPGPTPRASQRIASPVDIEKIRATSLPLRTMGTAVALAIVLLAITGFVYGKVRSRIPAVKVPKLAGAGGSSPGASAAGHLPPPAPIPLPPPVVEDAVADTVIFEPPPSHHAPEVIADHAEEVVETSEAPKAPDEPETSGASDKDSE